jgi:hypothetical protein
VPCDLLPPGNVTKSHQHHPILPQHVPYLRLTIGASTSMVGEAQQTAVVSRVKAILIVEPHGVFWPPMPIAVLLFSMEGDFSTVLAHYVALLNVLVKESSPPIS